MSHTEAREVTYLNGHRIEVGGRVYAPERECRFSAGSYDDEERGIWESECGGRFELSCGTPVENWGFCPKCGGKVVE